MRRIFTLPIVLTLPVVLAFCKSAGEEDDTADQAPAVSEAAQSTDAATPPATFVPGDPDEDVLGYAELCKRELGITNPLPAMSCLSGTEVPITVDGQPLTQARYASLETTGCDKPQWLSSACHNYDFVQRIDVGNPDVDAILNCRQKYFTNHLDQEQRKTEVERASGEEKVTKYKLYSEFNDLGFILHNKKTGKACFFTIFGRSFNGAWLPPPDQRAMPAKADVERKLTVKPPAGYAEDGWYRDARTTYLTPRSTAGGNCIGCHDIGPFKHSPFIDQVGIVPTNRSKQLPYMPVGNVFQEQFRSRQLLEVTTELVEGSHQRCTTCHRMSAGGNTCSTFLDWSTGDDRSPRSASSRTYPAAAWMPLDHGVNSAEEFKQIFGPHVDRIKCCCQKPNAKGCKTRPFGPTKEEIGTLPSGRLLPEFKSADPNATESCL